MPRRRKHTPEERREIEALIADLNDPERKRWEGDWAAAVASGFDPAWREVAPGRYTCDEGARYDTPEKLVAAYRRSKKLH